MLVALFKTNMLSLRKISFSGKRLNYCREKSYLIYKSLSHNPFFNIAFENYLLTKERNDDDRILYLWRNGPSVIIGRFQSAWKECKVSKMEEEGINLVRRASGGGAVYQDLNNSIFSFFSSKKDNDVAANHSVITDALMTHSGIEAVPTGRNDMEVDGFKVSGAAFRQTGNRSLHHGTLLLDVDMTALSRYLTPNKLKMQSKGISSVSARVKNLKSIDPNISHDGICDALVDSFRKYHNIDCDVEEVDESFVNKEPKVQVLMDELMDHEWRFGREPAFTNNISTRFDWGTIDVYVTTRKGGVISEATIFSDALDTELITQLRETLINCEYSQTGLGDALRILAESYPESSPIRANIYELRQWLINHI